MASSVALGWMVAGLVIYLLEALLLYTQWQVPFIRHDFLLGSVPWALGLFWWLLANPEWGRGTWCEPTGTSGARALLPAYAAGDLALSHRCGAYVSTVGAGQAAAGAAGALLLYALIRRLPGLVGCCAELASLAESYTHRSQVAPVASGSAAPSPCLCSRGNIESASLARWRPMAAIWRYILMARFLIGRPMKGCFAWV